MYLLLASMELHAHAFLAIHLLRAFALSKSLSKAKWHYKAEKGSLKPRNTIIKACAQIGEWEMTFVMYHQLWYKID